jgi:hypothetical protein
MKQQVINMILELAQNVEDEVNQRYGVPLYPIHPVLKRKYNRDMAIVKQARAMAAEFQVEEEE